MAVQLNDGSSMPTLAFGFWNIPAEQCALALESAIDAGYTCLDFAAIYGNEVAIGETLSNIFKSGKAKREDLFIVSKLWATDWHQVDKACAKTLSDLQLDYLDLYLVHTAVGVDKEAGFDAKGRKIRPRIANYELWGKMEELVKAGKTKSIGVSNWSCLQLADAFSYAKIPPAVNQVEIHPTFSNEKLAQWCLSVDMAVMGYCTLGPGKPDMTLEAVKQAAERLTATPAQVLMKWSQQKGYIPITKSVTPDRIKSNRELAFHLNEEEMKALDASDGGLKMKVCDQAGEFGLPIYD